MPQCAQQDRTLSILGQQYVNRMSHLKKTVFLSLLLAFSACKKEVRSPDGRDRSGVTDKEAMIMDSVFFYAKVLSLWQEYLIPRNVHDLQREGLVRSYTEKHKTAEDVLKAQIALTPRDLSTGKPVDRFSFLDRGANMSRELQDGVETGYGLFVFYLSTENSGDDAHLYVRMVDRNSPAESAGIQRGDRILSINGNTNIGYNAQQKKGFSEINAYLRSGSMTVRFAKPSGGVAEAEIANVRYPRNPVLDSRVIEQAGKKIGYFAFDSFMSLSTGFRGIIDAVFNGFESEGISDMVVDLRYNGGGEVATAVYLANRLAPASADGKLMFTYKINPLLESWGWLEDGTEDGFGPVRFAKKGNLDLPRLYFLVSENSASASELLINVLKPYVQVHLVGRYVRDGNNRRVAQNTYGKPVGYFGVPMVDRDIELYVASFSMYNKDGEGDYYAGLVPDGHVWEFHDMRNFGDVQEPMLASALAHARGDGFTTYPSTGPLSAIGGQQKPPMEKRKSADMQENRTRTGMFKFPNRELRK